MVFSNNTIANVSTAKIAIPYQHYILAAWAIRAYASSSHWATWLSVHWMHELMNVTPATLKKLMCKCGIQLCVMVYTNNHCWDLFTPQVTQALSDGAQS